MDVQELKDRLKVKTNRQLADIFKVKETAISNWGRTGVPDRIVKMVDARTFGIIGDNNHVVNHCYTSKEAAMLCEILEQWDEKKRKRLLRIALEMDEE
ncbi:MAG TPA: hypothetical protein DCS42_10910 [Nitrospiraceae bacterium]|nr:hypothetical protein [Nitrospiraceae bacterium]